MPISSTSSSIDANSVQFVELLDRSALGSATERHLVASLLDHGGLALRTVCLNVDLSVEPGRQGGIYEEILQHPRVLQLPEYLLGADCIPWHANGVRLTEPL